MIPKLERDALLAELVSLEQLLAELPAGDVVVRMNLTERIEEIRTAVAEPAFQEPEKWAHAALFFAGDPVVAKMGIDATFASQAIGSFQDIVSATSAVKRRGPMSQTGPIPDRKASSLHITGVVRGSFGFELTELDTRQVGEPLLGRTPLADDLEDALKILAAAGENDEAFVDAIADADGRVVSAVRDFFKLVRQRGATFRMVSGALDKAFDHSAVVAAAERSGMTLSEEQDTPIPGTFGGAFPNGRRFEHTTGARETIRGGVASDLSADDIVALNREWSGRECVAHMRVVRVTRAGALPHLRYTLLRLEQSS